MDVTPVPAAPAPPPAAARRRWPWALALSFGVLLAVLVGTGGTVAWMLHSERGSAWLLARVPGVSVERPSGRLLGDFGADAITWRFGDGGELRLVQPSWRGFTAGRSSVPGAWLRLSFDRLEAAQAHLTLPRPQPSQGARTPPPAQLGVPVELIVRALRIGALHAAPLGDEPLRDLQAAIHLGAEQGRAHRVDGVGATRGPVTAHADVRIETRAPLASTVRVEARSAAGGAGLPPWTATLNLQGPLAEAQLAGRLVVATPAPQTLDLRATLQPFADWPVAAATVMLQGLDTSALVAAAPRTALSGRIELTRAGAGRPIGAQLALSNERPGAWTAGLLPVSRIDATLAADAAAALHVDLRMFELVLGSPRQPAGRISGRGAWAADGWSLDLELADTRPDRLHAAAPASRLNGPLRLHGTASRLALEADLSGRLGRDAATLLAAATGEADGSGRLVLDVRQLRAAVGMARAELKGRAERGQPAGPWQLAGELALQAFDPAPWWPAMHQGDHRLNATGRFDLVLPPDPAALSALRGQADLRLTPSRLAGVGLAGEARLLARGDADGLSAALKLDAAGNRIDASGRFAADARRDHWEGRVDAPALQRLAPLARLFASGGRVPAVGGSVRAEFVADGRWPALQTRGEMQARAVVAPGVQLASGDARWQLGTAARAPLRLNATLAGLRLETHRVPRLTVDLSGTTDAHRIALDADVLAGERGPRTRAQLAAAGAFDREAGGSPLALAGWHGRIERAEVRAAEAREPLLRTAGVDLLWKAPGPAAPMRMALQPGRAEVMGGVLRWQRLSWEAAAGARPMQLDADITLEPMQVVPLLARLQPQLQWAGGLEIGGRAVVRTAPTFHADVELHRTRGDLQLRLGTGPRALGLGELRLAAKADGTQWRATGRVASTAFGEATADVTARTGGAGPWPTAQTPIEGSLQLRIADLGIYDPLLPVGWRLDGRLSADARLGGRLGAPEYTGRLSGNRIAVGNFVEGVRVQDGELLATLDGQSGRIERFVARAGDGQVRLDGSATFGAQPAMQLALVADRFRALSRTDRQIDVSGDATLRLDAAGIALKGRMKVDRGLVDLGRSEAPELSNDVRVVDGPTPGRPPTSGEQPATRRPLQADLRIDLGEQLRVRGKGIDTRLAGEVRIASADGKLALDGTVRTVQGTYQAYGETLKIERGLITFAGPVDNPRLDIQAYRPDVREVEVGVAISGTAQNPRVQLVSTPEMSDLDKLSWLTLGRSSAGLATDQTALLQRAALALFAGRGGRGGGEGLSKRLGLDTISVGRGESGGLSDAVISLGKQISERFYVGYAQGLNATTAGWELVYRLGQRAKLRVLTGESTAVDLVWTWLWG